MEALVGVRRGHLLHRRLVRVIPDDPPARRPGPGDVVRIGLWMGIVAGFAEVGGILAMRELAGLVSVQTLRTNWHFTWMIPLSYVFLFGAAGLACGLVGWLSRGRIGFRPWAHLLSFLLVLPASCCLLTLVSFIGSLVCCGRRSGMHAAHGTISASGYLPA